MSLGVAPGLHKIQKQISKFSNLQMYQKQPFPPMPSLSWKTFKIAMLPPASFASPSFLDLLKDASPCLFLCQYFRFSIVYLLRYVKHEIRNTEIKMKSVHVQGSQLLYQQPFSTIYLVFSKYSVHTINGPPLSQFKIPPLGVENVKIRENSEKNQGTSGGP